MELTRLADMVHEQTVGAEGNVSQRFHDDRMIIKSSGARLKGLTSSNMTVCNFDNDFIIGKKPSMEYEFHKLLYELYPDVHFIAHTHPVHTMKILCGPMRYIKKFANNRYFPDQVVYNGATSAIVPYATPGEPLKKEILKAYNSHKEKPCVYLLQNHGIITLGDTVESCAIKAEICEKSAQIFSPKNKPLTKQEVNVLIKHPDEKYRKGLTNAN